MNVCHIISGDLWAGAEVMTYHLLRGLMNYPDIELSVILFNEGKLTEEIRRLGIAVEVVEESEQGFLRFLRNIKAILGRKPPDILHSHRLKENLVGYLSSIQSNDIRFVCTQHGMPESVEKDSWFKYLILMKMNIFVISKRFAYMVAVSENVRSGFVHRFGVPYEKIAMIHNGIKIQRFSQKEKHGGDFVIGSSGRLFPVKDYPFMVEIAEIVLKKADGIRFELAGDGPEMGKLRKLIYEKGMGNCFVLRGFMDNVSSFYSGLDLYLNTSLHEGIPMSVLEAMSHGLPVVAPNVGGLMEILVDGVHGHLVDGRNPDAFARKCLKLIENKNLLLQMGKFAQKRIEEEYSVERMVNSYHQLYLHMMQN